jgi:isoaspartyl peptidase/L-asparaginase-like protein (Ntn-hydrolase superfamily)
MFIFGGDSIRGFIFAMLFGIFIGTYSSVFIASPITVEMDKLVKIGGEGGLVAIDAKGNIEMPFNSEGMYRASINMAGEKTFGIYR